MIVFSAIVPHSPLLLPSIGKTHRDKLSATLSAISDIEQALYLSKAETICLIAPHGVRYPDAFNVNLASKYVGNLKQFGDFSTTVTAKSDYLMIDRIQRKLRAEGVPFTLSSNEELDYGFAVPLLLLTSHLASWKLVPISPSMHDGKAHFEFGKQLKRVLHSEDERVAVIASADMSHKLSADAPGGFAKEGSIFDAAVKESITAKNPNALLALDAQTTESAAQCAYLPVITLLGVLDGMNITPKILSYESPFGVGYLTVSYDLA